MAKILIIGSKGQLGHDCIRTFAQHTTRAVDLPEIDITSLPSVQSICSEFRPDFVINCAAYTAVDQAESDAARCARINTEGPQILAAVCQQLNAFLVHISTDYVFRGDRTPPQPWLESDTPDPQTVYGRTKLAGEEAIVVSGCRFAILRTAWLYGIHGKNFPKTMLRLALATPSKPIRVVADQFGCPTGSAELAHQIRTLIEAPIPPQGRFHATAQGFTSWFDFAKAFLTLMAVPHTLIPCTSAEYPTPAKRPTNSILEDAALKAQGLCSMPNWHDALAQFVQTNRQTLLDEAYALLQS